MKRSLTLAVLALVALTLLPAAASPAPGTRAHAVAVFAPRGTAGDCTRVLPLRRTVTGPQLLRGTMQALLAGPTKAERARGYGGWFSRQTAGHLRSVRITDGVAHIDFRSFARDIPNASTSCGSAFYDWLQRDAPGEGP
jgi:hypothetical protein